MDDVFEREQAATYDFGDPTPPDGFDPENVGWQDPTVGWHRFRVTDYKVKVNHEMKYKGDVYVLNQLRAILQVSTGPETGARVMAFIPLPTPGKVMPPFFANQWGQYVQSLGFELPDNSMIPKGFGLESQIYRECQAKIEHQLDGNNEIRLKPNGEPSVGVALYGFRAADFEEAPPEEKQKTTTRKKRAQQPEPAGVTDGDDFEL